MKQIDVNRSNINHPLVKAFLILIISLTFSLNGKVNGEKIVTKISPSPINRILKNIRSPGFKKVSYNITSFGAVGDGKTDTKPIIDKVINLCSATGGGQVIIPKGTFFVAGPVILKSNVNLHFEEDAEIIFSANEKNYLPAVLTLWEGTELYNYSPLIYAYQCSNIAITGNGKINGSASKNFATWRPQGSEEQNKLRQMGIDAIPVDKRIFGQGFHTTRYDPAF